MIKPKRQKKCQNCGTLFTPFNTIEKWCSPSCGYAIHLKNEAKKERKKSYLRKQALKSRNDWIKDAQVWVNKFIRARDIAAGLPCVSCGKYNVGQMHAGHYRATSISPSIRFHHENIWLQCAQCNLYKHGNLIEYRIELIKRIGLSRVEWLEEEHPPSKWTIEELQNIINIHKKLYNELKNKI